MKAEHRKELQTNVLADSIGRFWLSLKAAPSSTTIAVWVFILLSPRQTPMIPPMPRMPSAQPPQS